MGGFGEGPAGSIDVPEMERRNMSLAEHEQCALDDFWGMVANQVEQAEATAAMEREDRRSQDVRARIKKEERYKIWEEEDLRKRETRSVVRENLEDAARREYLEVFYSAPSVDTAMNYCWPTRATLLGQVLGEQSSDSMLEDMDAVLTATHSGDDSLYATTRGGGSSGGDDARSALSTAQTSRDIYNEWSASRSSGVTVGESSRSTRPFHVFRGKKAHQIIPVQDCFIPPRHLTEPTTKHGLVAVHELATAARPAPLQPAVASPAGLSKAVHLPPMIETPRDNRLTAGLAGSNATVGSTGDSLKKPFLTGETPSRMSSFERKLAARREQWAREEEADAEERAFHEQHRTQELLRGFNKRGGHGKGGQGYSYKVGTSTGIKSHPPPAGGGYRNGNGDSRRTRKRQARSRDWRDCGDSRGEEGKVAELLPEREEQLLTQMFDMLDARNRGEVRLDEVLFYMTENAQVKSVLKQVTLWTLIKTRRWEWVEELLAAQPARTLTLPALLDFSRGLYEESGVPRRHLRLARAVHEWDVEQRDIRSTRLLPVDLLEGSEVEALFRKGFVWYRAWVVKCHPNDTFDVRFTRPPSTPSEDTSVRKGAAAGREQRPEVETSSQGSGSEEDWNSDEENSTLQEEEEWKATCDSVARYIGMRTDLGRTETEVLADAFDAIAKIVLPPKAGPKPATNRDAATRGISGGEEGRPGKAGEEDGNGDGDGTPGDVLEAPRVPAADIIRMLRAGAVDEYRRASPALSAACIYKEFANGLGVASKSGVDGGARRENLGSSLDEGDHPCDTTEGGARHTQQGDPIGEDDGRRGVSREEFCDYFEAVADLVDLNGLSLVPQVHQGLVPTVAV